MCASETGAAKATFNGQTSGIQYSYVPASELPASNISVTFRIRTRAVNATLVLLAYNSIELSASVELSNGTIVVYDNVSSTGAARELSSHSTVNDGQWHNVSVDLTPVFVSVSVDNYVHQYPSNITAESVGQLFNSSSFAVFVGHGDSGSVDRRNQTIFFKGCFDEIRINNLLLPFARELTNVTAENRFSLSEVNDVDVGCHGDAVCNQSVCANNGTCVDMWHAFVCHCMNGFNGTTCEQNIDECAVGNDCDNGATCVDGINSYSCHCLPGYTGLR